MKKMKEERDGSSGGMKDTGWIEAESAFKKQAGNWDKEPSMPPETFNASVEAYQGDQLGSEGQEHSKK